MNDTGSWVGDYSSTLSHWLLVGGAVMLAVLITYFVLKGLGVKGETATGFALIMPWVLGFLIFSLFPFFASLYLSFTDYNILRPISFDNIPALIGFRNYTYALSGGDPNFWPSIQLTLLNGAIGIPLGIAGSLFTAMLLARNVKGVGIWRTIYYLPAVLPAAAMALLWRWMFNPSNGLINTILSPFLSLFGLQKPGWFTDANLVLGRIEPDAFLGGKMRLDEAAARKAIATVADPHAWSVEQAALAIVRIMNNNMVGALRAVLVEQGYDPREFTLLTYGGAGPLHICDLMHEANIPRGIVPNHPGQFSAYGFTMADARSDRRRSVLMSSRRFDVARANSIMEDLTETVLADLRRQGHTTGVKVNRSLQMRYLGQNYELELPLKIERFTEENLGSVWDDFHRLFEERYRFHLPEESIEVVDMGCSAVAEMAMLLLMCLRRA